MSAALSVAMELLGLVNVIVDVETPPTLMLAGLKDLLSVGGTLAGGITVRLERHHFTARACTMNRFGAAPTKTNG